MKWWHRVNKNDTVGIQSSGFYYRGTCITRSDQPTSKQAEANAALDGRPYVYLLPAEDSCSTTMLESK